MKIICHWNLTQNKYNFASANVINFINQWNIFVTETSLIIETKYNKVCIFFYKIASKLKIF